jgi:DNA-binding MarR family transcriptional regulator
MTALVRQAHQGIDKFVAKFAAENKIKLTPRQVEVLIAIAEHPNSNTTQIALETGLDTPTASDIVRRLRSRGWVQTVDIPGDTRAKNLELTKRGRDMVTLARKIHGKAEKQIGEAVDREKTFIDRLRAIAGLAENDA